MNKQVLYRAKSRFVGVRSNWTGKVLVANELLTLAQIVAYGFNESAFEQVLN